MVQKASFAVAATFAASTSGTALAQDTDDGFIGAPIKPVESYDVNEGPTGFKPIPTPQEFFAPGGDGERFLQGLTDMGRAFEQGYRDGETISDFFIVPAPAKEIKTIDPEQYVQLAKDTIDPACETLDEAGLHGCTAAYLNFAGGFGDAALGYINANVPDSPERNASIDNITRICSTAITNISNSTFRNNFQYAQVGITAASMCMVVAEDHGKAAGVGIDFLPSTRAYVLERAQTDRNATNNFTRPASP